MCILSCYLRKFVQFNDCKGIMPAKIGDPVSTSLRQSLSAAEHSEDLDKRLALTSSQVLSVCVEYEKTESYNSSVLDNLKHKYIKIDADKPLNGLPHTQRAVDNQSNQKMRPEPDSELPTPKVILFPSERIQLGWRGNCPVGAGMINVGNTCYLNSTLQALFHIPALVNWLHSDSDHLNKCSVANGSVQGECINCAMSKTLKASQNKSGNVIKPFLIYNKLKMICKHMVHGQQEDAHEFMRYLIESMEETYLVRFKGEKLDNYSKETTPLNQIFGGYMRTEVNCLQCRGVSTTFQHFQDLLLDIRRASTLDDALASYFQRERLDGDDAYRCERCHKKVSATKKFSIEKPPSVLCIQLKRFSMVGGKINKHVSFTQRLDMTRFLCPQSAYRSSQPLTYRLVSMVTHMGTSVHCGHYTAIAQTSTGNFYQFDDSAVRPISLNAALETNAYVIIYELERPDVRQSQNHSTSSKPATITSGTSTPILATNGLKSNASSTFIGPLLPSSHKPGPSLISSSPSVKLNSASSPMNSNKLSQAVIPAVHKPLALPPAKERDRITFGLHPRLVMRIKNGTVCQPSTQENKQNSSLVPYDSDEDSSESDSEKNEKKPDMPSLEPYSERKVSTPNKQNLPLVKQSELFPARSKSPSPGSPFLYKSGELSSSYKPVVCHEMHSKTPSPRASDSSQMQKAMKPSSSSPDRSPATCNKNIDPRSPVSSKNIVENSKYKKHEGNSGVSNKRQIKSDSPDSVCNNLVEGNVDCIQSLQVDTKLSGNGNGKSSAGGWQVTDMSLHSPSCHSESSNTSVASSTTPWSVSDVKKSSKKLPRTLDSVDNSNLSPSLSKQSVSLCNYSSDNETEQLSRSNSTSCNNSIESVTDPSSRPTWEVSPSIPGVHHNRCTDKEENSPVVVIRRGNSNSSPEKYSKDRKKIVERKYEPYHNGNHKSPKGGNDSEEYEWVEKTHESLGLGRSNGQINGWGHSSRSDHVVTSHLMKMSHQGYGPSVSSWNGGRSHIDREIDNDRREERKRSHSKYDEELDMGRVKKVKHNEFNNSQPKSNYFDDFQKRFNYKDYYESHHSRGKCYKKDRKGHYNQSYHRQKYNPHRNSYHNVKNSWRH